MLSLLILAARNLRRNARRTLITLAAVSFGLAIMVVVVTMMAGQHHDMRSAALRTLIGHAIVRAPGYYEAPERVVPQATALTADLRAAFPEATVTPRLYLGGLLTSPRGTRGILVQAVDPDAEAVVQTVDDQLVAGEWLAADDDRGLVIGQAMADTLQVGLGDRVVFMGQLGGDDVESRMFRVRGIFRSGAPELDGMVGFAHHHAGHELFGGRDVAHQIALHVAPGTDDEAAALRLAEVVAARLGPAAADVESLHWSDALPELWALLRVDAASNDVMMGALGLIVAMGVLNTMLMSVMERTRELGVLMAIGMRPGRLALLVLLEGFVLGVLGAVVGISLGVVLAYPIVAYGLDFRGQLGESFDTGGVVVSALIKGRYEPTRLLGYAVAGVLFTTLAAAWPAWRVTRMSPLNAMRAT